MANWPGPVREALSIITEYSDTHGGSSFIEVTVAVNFGFAEIKSLKRRITNSVASQIEGFGVRWANFIDRVSVGPVDSARIAVRVTASVYLFRTFANWSLPVFRVIAWAGALIGIALLYYDLKGPWAGALLLVWPTHALSLITVRILIGLYTNFMLWVFLKVAGIGTKTPKLREREKAVSRLAKVFRAKLLEAAENQDENEKRDEGDN